MNGVHDLGGMHGFGSIEREDNEPLFRATWEAHVRAGTTLVRDRGYFNLDAFRYGIERMEPAQYLRATYFERWLASVEYNLIQQGFISSDELDARVAFLREHTQADTPRASSVTLPPLAQESLPESPTPGAPQFALGDAVVTRNIHPRGHTRLPRYARGKRGVIHLLHGPQTFPDTNAHGLGQQPQMVYNVRFEGRELWGESSEPREAVYLDLWESYLEAVQS
ncbi:MAG: nitrile hydratase subunit beta [Chloroflexota bacterium]